MISEHSAHLTPLSVDFRTWLWRYTYLLLLISMIWHRQAIFKSKGDKLCSSAESRIWTRDPRHQIASRLNARWQTDWAIEDQAKNLNSTARPYDQRAFSPLDPTASRLSHLALAIYIFVVVNFDALAQASDIQTERRQVVFLCWMQDLNTYIHTYIPHTFIHTYIHTYLLLLISMLWHRQVIFESKGDKLSSPAEGRIRTQRVSDTYSPADWMPSDKPTELSRIKLKTWTRQPVLMISKHSAHLTPLPFGIRTWLWRFTYLLLLISMLWHRQAIFESKGDKLSSSAESRIRTQRVSDTYSPADWMPADKPTALSRIKLKTWTRQPVPMISKHSAHLTPLPFGIRTWLWRYTYLLLLISMLWYRQAIFESKGNKLSSSAEGRIRTQRVSDTYSPADWMPADKPTELLRIKLKTRASDIQIERRQVVFLCWMQDLNPGTQTPNRQQTECPLTNRLSYRGSSKKLELDSPSLWSASIQPTRPHCQLAFAPGSGDIHVSCC